VFYLLVIRPCCLRFAQVLRRHQLQVAKPARGRGVGSMLLDAVESVKKHSKLRSMYISLLKSMSGIMARISTDDAQPENAIVPWYESKGSVRAHHQVLG
jgi:GNAT superfamily N-acetyltransferase